MSAFDQAFDLLLGHEGAFSDNPADPGNWTGGRCGVGECRGTNWGISAAAYPSLDIRSLARNDARAIYRRDYWDRIQGDILPPPLALLVFDAAVNLGTSRAVQLLQAALGVEQDGRLGPLTLTAIAAQNGSGAALCAEFQARRLCFMASLPVWKTFALGWARRLCSLPFQALGMKA
jgi:lysozyme family protein